jgi:hypothetical protein
MADNGNKGSRNMPANLKTRALWASMPGMSKTSAPASHCQRKGLDDASQYRGKTEDKDHFTAGYSSLFMG